MKRRTAIKLMVISYLSINFQFIKNFSITKKKIVNNWILSETDI